MVPALTVDAALAQVQAGIDALAELDLRPSDAEAALALARGVELAGRQVRAVQIDAIAAIEESGLHGADGHASGWVMAAHAGHLSERDGRRRDRARRMLAEMPAMHAALADGKVGVCHVDRASLVFVNPRVRAEFVALEAQVAMLAAVLPYDEFDRRLANWVREADEDGTADRARRAHENRRARLVQDFDGAWELLCIVGGLTGAQMHSVFRAFVDAEFAADWEAARGIHGDKTTIEHLARTHDQREADAIARIFDMAACAHAAAPGGAPIDTVVVMDDETFAREARRQEGADLDPRPVPRLDLLPTDPGISGSNEVGAGEEDVDGCRIPALHPGRRFRCETSDGCPIDPTEAFANAVAGRVRRMVVGWDGVVLDASGYHRLFTGALRRAVMLGHTRCYWPGCSVLVDRCQADHLDPRRNGGRTNPGNGAPACGRHNRLKEHGFTARRDERGRMHVHRPDGTEIE